MSNVPLSDHALLADCRSAALVTRRGSVDWLCLPRFDSPAVFARLLDHDAGHFRLAPAEEGFTSRWRYRPDSLVLETTWTRPGVTLVVTDAMALGPHERGHGLGRRAPGVLLRRAQCLQGSVDLGVDFVPRPEFGLVHPRLVQTAGALVAEGGAHVVVLSTGVALQVRDARASGLVRLSEGEDVTFAVEQGDAWGEPPKAWSAHRVRRRLAGAESTWASWSELHQRYTGPVQDLVRHSGRVLRGLSYAPTGAMVAAATTSLPEGVGSGRTWDYRFTWVRDASMTLQGLYVAACPDEAESFFSFLARASATQLERGLHLQIMFGIGAERDLHEHELTHLRGWCDSGPVRVGNDAWAQGQLDVYGAVLDAAWTLRDQLGQLQPATRTFLVAAAAAAARHWRDDDQGIWEIRGPARPFLHSKLMCWVALDRGLAMADLLRLEADQVAEWTRLRGEIRETILARGWNERLGAFTQTFGSDELDASALLVVLMGFLPVADPRLRSTIDAVEAALSDERGLIFRYRGGDDFDAPEGTFLLCTFWLAHALALIGEVERARAVLLRASGYATELGLLAEQVDPETGALWGNFPQAFSHLGLVNAAQALAEAEAAAQ